MKHRLAAVSIGALALASCIVPVPSGDDPLDVEFMSGQALRDYSETVFRRHNRIVTQRMMAPPPEDARARRQLERAEIRMNRACAALNETASMRSRGEDPDLGLENRVRRTVRECDRRTARLEALMNDGDDSERESR